MRRTAHIGAALAWLLLCGPPLACDSGSSSDADSGTDADTDADTDVDSDTDADADSDADADADADTGSDADADADADSDADADAGSEAAADADAGDEAEPEPVVPVQVTQGTLRVPGTNYDDYLVPYPAGDSYEHPESHEPLTRHGYSGLDWDAYLPARQFTLIETASVILENELIRVTLLPERGGRLWRMEYLPTGHDVFWRNPSGLYPAHYSYLGWWLAPGGIEYSFPLEEHGYVFSVPWAFSVEQDPDTGSATVRTEVQDPTTGLVLHVDYTLRPGRSDLELSLAVVNPTASEVSYQLWVNAMLAPGGGEDTLPDTEFLYATDRMIVHGGDPWIGQPREVIPWPVHKGYDLSRYSAWLERIDGAGLFVKDAQLRPGHVGAYVPSEDEGIAMAFDPTLARGVKLWCFGHLHRRDPPSCVDYSGCDQDGVPETVYFEIWRGVTESFFDFTTLAPGAELAWSESWGPFHGIGRMSCAGEEAVLSFEPPATAAAAPLTVPVAVAPRQDRPGGGLQVSLDGVAGGAIPAPASPAAPYTGELTVDLAGLTPGAHELTLLYDPGGGAAPVSCKRAVTLH